MIPFFVFLGVVAIVWGFMLYQNAYWKGYDKASFYSSEWRAVANNAYRQVEQNWDWLVKANARRKRLEKCLRRQRAFGQSMHRNNVNRLADINGLIKEVRRLEAENEILTRMHRSLAGELVSEVLSLEDRQTVTKGLTRKL